MQIASSYASYSGMVSPGNSRLFDACEAAVKDDKAALAKLRAEARLAAFRQDSDRKQLETDEKIEEFKRSTKQLNDALGDFRRGY
jgi:hypothetical protein